VIPFRLAFRPGISPFEQAVYAAPEAIVAGRRVSFRPDPEQGTRDQPQHGAQGHPVSRGLPEVKPGIGTAVAPLPRSAAAQRTASCGRELQARKLGMNLYDTTRASGALERHGREGRA
jgi:hypothetical protein